MKRSALSTSGEATIIERPIGDDPAELERLKPGLDIWDAYATIHLLMPDGSIKLGGEAVAEVFRAIPMTRWFTGLFSLSLFRVRPFQVILNAGYELLADVRPLFGCESCGTPPAWMRPFAWLKKKLFGRAKPHSTAIARRAVRAAPAVG